MAAIAPVLLSGILTGIVKTSSATVASDATYSPVGYVAPGVARWEDRSSGISIGFPSITMSVRPPSKTSRVYRITSKISIPTLEATSPSTSTGIQPAPTRAYDCQAVLEFLLPERCTQAERVKLLWQVVSLLSTEIDASDGVPVDTTASPLVQAIATYDRPF